MLKIFIHSFSRGFLVAQKSLTDNHLNAFIHSLHVFMPCTVTHTHPNAYTVMQSHLLATISFSICLHVHSLAISLSISFYQSFTNADPCV
jgi:ribonuclease HIII